MMIVVKAMGFDDYMKDYIMIMFKIQFASLIHNDIVPGAIYSYMGFQTEAEARNFFKDNKEIPHLTQHEGPMV